VLPNKGSHLTLTAIQAMKDNHDKCFYIWQIMEALDAELQKTIKKIEIENK
jgi:hypothetical protein